MRSLAQRCSKAAPKITVLTEFSSTFTFSGLQRMKEIVADVEFLYSRLVAMKRIVHCIGEAACGQGRGVSTIAHSLTALDRQTQSTVAAAEQLCSAAATTEHAIEVPAQSVAMLEQL